MQVILGALSHPKVRPKISRLIISLTCHQKSVEFKGQEDSSKTAVLMELLPYLEPSGTGNIKTYNSNLKTTW